jgi:hypothetical protein
VTLKTKQITKYRPIYSKALFRRENGEEPFFGIIVSPFDPCSPAPLSRFTYWQVREFYRKTEEMLEPICIKKQIQGKNNITQQVFDKLSQLVQTYRTHE